MIMIILPVYLLILAILLCFWFIVAYNIYAISMAILCCVRPLTVDSFFTAYLTCWRNLWYYFRRKFQKKKIKKVCHPLTTGAYIIV